MGTIHYTKWTFILNRVNDRAIHSKKWIIGYALLFWLVTRIIMMAVITGCISCYEHFGVSPEEITTFGGDPTALGKIGTPVFRLLLAGLIAPVFEECVFRLGLSFKRWQVALNLAAIPFFVVYMMYFTKASVIQWSIAAICSALLILLVYRFTTNEFWTDTKKKWLVPAIWITSIAFGLLHLLSFSRLTVGMLPYALCIVLMVFFGGCSIAYLRVNLGFGWGVAMHIFNNLPALAIMLAI